MKEKNSIYLHIGTAKTGSSALQAVLAENEKLLEKHGFVYPKGDAVFFNFFNREGIDVWDEDTALKNVNCARPLDVFSDIYSKLENKRYNDFTFLTMKEADEIFRPDVLAGSEGWNEFIKETDRLLEENNVIYSNEVLSHMPTIIKRLHERYEGRLKIIIYLRRQDRFTESVWAELIVSNLINIPFEDFLMMVSYTEGMAEMSDYGAILDYIASVVGKENLYARAYKKKNPDGKKFNIVDDFFEVLGIEEKPQASKSWINAHISGNAIEYLRVYNATINALNLRNRVTKARHKRLMGYLRNIMKKGGKDLYFKPGMRRAFMRKFEEGNLYVSKNYLGGELLDSEGVSMESAPTIRKLTEQEIETVRFITALIMSGED